MVARAVAIVLMFAANGFALADDANDYRSGNANARLDRWQFLPRDDPEQADRYFKLIQLDEEMRRAGFIELFLLSFGR